MISVLKTQVPLIGKMGFSGGGIWEEEKGQRVVRLNYDDDVLSIFVEVVNNQCF